jgi:hypothetical protein
VVDSERQLQAIGGCAEIVGGCCVADVSVWG